MPLSMVWVQASAPAWCGGDLSLRLRHQTPNSSRTSGPTRPSSMSMRISSSCTAPLEAPLPLTNLRREVAPLEIVWDSDETLAVSTDHHLLDRVSIGMPLMSLGLSPLQLKRLYKTRATRLLAEAVSSSEESPPGKYYTWRPSPISLGTSSPRHNLQNNKKFRHKW